MIEQGRTAAETVPTFDSKVDRIRRTYGFDDVSLAPGIETVEPADVDLGQVFCGLERIDPRCA